MELTIFQTVEQVKAELLEFGEHVEELGLTDSAIQHMIEQGF